MNIYKKGNYIEFLNEAENILQRRRSIDIRFEKDSQSAVIYKVFYNDVLFLTIPFAEIEDETNTVYASQAIFDAWHTENTGFNPATGGSVADVLVYVTNKIDLPLAVNGVITLAANATYFFTKTVDLTGDRLVCGANTTILGFSSENCKIISTGLSSSTALISSSYSLPIRNIAFTSGTVLNLVGDSVTTALDWHGVNFVDCPTVGLIKDYSNVILETGAFLNSANLTIDGTIGTVGINNNLFDGRTGQTTIIVAPTAIITRRLRIIYSSFVCLSGETAINVSASATIADERYILDTVNFSGGGTYLTGVTETSNKALFSGCVGITNAAVNGQLYMQSNATATVISASNTFYKVLGTTTASADNSKYTHTNNRLTNAANVSRKYLIQCVLSFTSGATHVCEFGFYDSKLDAIRTPSKTKATSNAGGRAENVSFACVVSHSNGDFIEIHAANNTSAQNLTITDMNFLITEIK
jgi:hypothetical protein